MSETTSTTTVDTVVLDREIVMGLVREALTVTDVFEVIAGTCPTPLTAALCEKASAVAEAILGPMDDNDDVGPVFDLWAETRSQALRRLRKLGEDEGRDAR